MNLTTLHDRLDNVGVFLALGGIGVVLMMVGYMWLAMKVVHIAVAKRMVEEILTEEHEATAMRLHEVITNGPMRVSISLGFFYTIMRSLERKGIVTHHNVYDNPEVTAMRGGLPRVYYRLVPHTKRSN